MTAFSYIILQYFINHYTKKMYVDLKKGILILKLDSKNTQWIQNLMHDKGDISDTKPFTDEIIDLISSHLESEENLQLKEKINNALTIGGVVLDNTNPREINVMAEMNQKYLDMSASLMNSSEKTLHDCALLKSEVLNTLNKFNAKTSTSSVKGCIAENFIENILQKRFPDSTVTNLSQTSNSSDILVKSDFFPTIVIESKFYTTTVDTKEVEKLKRDMKKQDYKYAIFISQTSSISKKKGGIDFEEFDNDRRILYCSNFDFNDLVISSIFNLWRIMCKELEKKNLETNGLLMDDIGFKLTDSIQKLIDASKENNTWYQEINSLIVSIEGTLGKVKGKINYKHIQDKIYLDSIIGNFKLYVKQLDINSEEIPGEISSFLNEHPLEKEITDLIILSKSRYGSLSNPKLSNKKIHLLENVFIETRAKTASLCRGCISLEIRKNNVQLEEISKVLY